MNKRNLKVGEWWNKLDEKQQEAFKILYFVGGYDVNSIRKFLSAVKKQFSSPVYWKKFNVDVDGKVYAYSHDNDRFTDVTEFA